MTENQLSKIIERIQKLMALSESSNEHEAALAAAKASELLAQYELDMATVEGHWKAEAPEIAEERTPWSYSRGTRTAWEVDLASAIGLNNRCKVLVNKRHIHWIGNRRTIQIVAYLHAQLATRLQIMASEAVRRHIEYWRERWETTADVSIDGPFHHTKIGMIAGSHNTTIAYRNSWLQGAVSGVAHQLYEMRRAFEKSSENAKALIVLSDGALDLFMKEHYPRTSTLNMRSSRGTGWGDGYAAGRKMSIHSGLSGSSSAPSLKGGK